MIVSTPLVMRNNHVYSEYVHVFVLSENGDGTGRFSRNIVVAPEVLFS